MQPLALRGLLTSVPKSDWGGARKRGTSQRSGPASLWWRVDDSEGQVNRLFPPDDSQARLGLCRSCQRERLAPTGAEELPRGTPVFATSRIEGRRRGPLTNATLEFGLVDFVGPRVHALAHQELNLLVRHL